MSGGSYDYLYIRLEEAGKSITQRKDNQPTRQIISKLLNGLGKMMYEIEWEDSGDGGDWGKVNKELRKIFNISDFDLELIKKLNKYDMIKKIIGVKGLI